MRTRMLMVLSSEKGQQVLKAAGVGLAVLGLLFGNQVQLFDTAPVPI